MSKPERVTLVSLGIIAAVAMAVCGVYYLVAPVAVDGLRGFLPDGGEMDQSRDALNLAYAAGLVIYALAAAPVVAVCATRCHRMNPVLVVTAAVWLELSFLVELVNNLPLVARFLMPPSATPAGLSDEALTHFSQLEALDYLSFDVPGFTLAYVGLAIFAAILYRRDRTLAVVTAASFALFLANTPFLWIEPKNLASVLMGLCILPFAAFPLVMTRISLRRAQEEAVCALSTPPSGDRGDRGVHNRVWPRRT